MREQIEVGAGSEADMSEAWRVGRPVEQHGRRRERRRARGPRPSRPSVVSVAVRPAPSTPPRCPSARGRRRVLVGRRSAVRSGSRRGERVLRGMAGLGVIVLAAAVVVGLGLLAGVGGSQQGPVAVGRTAVPPASWPASVPAQVVPGARTVTVAPGETLWDVARRVAPVTSGPELAGVAERLVTDNSLTSVRLRPGQVLWVPDD
ncbi:MAG: LysM peptidoglycan-binding domain-containing protein [Pseudonocardia sp.]